MSPCSVPDDWSVLPSRAKFSPSGASGSRKAQLGDQTGFNGALERCRKLGDLRCRIGQRHLNVRASRTPRRDVRQDGHILWVWTSARSAAATHVVPSAERTNRRSAGSSRARASTSAICASNSAMRSSKRIRPRSQVPLTKAAASGRARAGGDGFVIFLRSGPTQPG